MYFPAKSLILASVFTGDSFSKVIGLGKYTASLGEARGASGRMRPEIFQLNPHGSIVGFVIEDRGGEAGLEEQAARRRGVRSLGRRALRRRAGVLPAACSVLRRRAGRGAGGVPAFRAQRALAARRQAARVPVHHRAQPLHRRRAGAASSPSGLSTWTCPTARPMRTRRWRSGTARWGALVDALSPELRDVWSCASTRGSKWARSRTCWECRGSR